MNSDVERLTTILHDVVKTPSPKKPLSSKKKQATHYLDQEVFVELGQLKEKLRNKATRPSLISKSSIVNAMLHLLLEEQNTKRSTSPRLKRILKKLQLSQTSPPTR